MTRSPIDLPPGYDNATVLSSKFQSSSEAVLLQAGEERALEVFRLMSRRVPAYQHFLHSQNIDPSSVRSAADLVRLPALDKDNYLRKYPRAELCWDGVFDKSSWVVSTTSGSTGEPFYFPRQDLQDKMYALSAELYMRANFRIHERSTLYIVAFAMGPWIGGLFTYEALKQVASKGYALTILTTGINKTEVVRAVQKLGSEFDQVIIGSYPPVMKDIIDEGLAVGLDWSQYDLKVVFSAEGFSETFRQYIIDKGGIKNDLTGTLNHYGTVDLGTMSHETPLSILVRRLLLANEAAYVDIFGEGHRLPTLTQYDPSLFYFEATNGRLYCTTTSGYPLVRYDLKDHGGVITKVELEERLAQHGINLAAEAAKADLEIWNLPFVYVYERADLSVKFLGFEVFPEPIRKALEQPAVHHQLTGKFTLMSEYNQASEQQLLIHAELKSGIVADDKLKLTTSRLVVEWLERENPIYRMNREVDKHRTEPVITFWPYEDQLHFSGKGKQKWVKQAHH